MGTRTRARPSKFGMNFWRRKLLISLVDFHRRIVLRQGITFPSDYYTLRITKCRVFTGCKGR